MKLLRKKGKRKSREIFQGNNTERKSGIKARGQGNMGTGSQGQGQGHAGTWGPR